MRRVKACLRCDLQSWLVELHALADGVVHHFRDVAAPVEFLQSRDDRVAFGYCAGVLDGFPKRGIRNINGRIDASKTVPTGIPSI